MRSRVFLPVLILVGSFALPLVAYAAIPFFGPIIPKGIEQVCPLGWGAVINIINNIISFLLTIAILFVAPVMVAYAGFLYVVNPMNPSGISKARGILLNTVIGIVIALAGWLIVDAVMAVLYNPSAVGSTWSNLIMSNGIDPCIKQAGALPTDTLNQATTSPNIGTGVNSGAGKCIKHDDGPCAVSNMTIFGTAANQASVICSAESANGVLLQGDRTTDGIPVSFGLFQINITANPVGTLDCPKAFDSMFTGSHHNVKILSGKQALYNDCKQAALTPANNIQAAYDIFRKSNYSWNKWSTHTMCGLTFLEGVPVLGRLCAIISSYD